MFHSIMHALFNSKRQMATIQQIKAARALLEWSQEDLAERTGQSVATIRRLEGQGKISVSNEAQAKMEAALEAAGIEFTNGKKPGVRLNKRGKERKNQAG